MGYWRGRNFSGGANKFPSDKFNEGRPGRLLEFDGVDDYVNAGSGSSLDNLTELTISAWVKIKTTGQYDRIISKNYTHRFEAREGRLYIQKSYSTTNLNAQSSVSLATNTWYHVVVTYSESGDRKAHFFVNGSETAKIPDTASAGTITSDATGNLTIGAETGAVYLWDGLIDEVRVYNRALSADEIGQLYRAGARKMQIIPTKGYKTIIK